MGEARVQTQILELRQVPAFRSVPPHVLAELAAAVEVEEVACGVDLLREGERPASLGWIVEGQASWSRARRRLGLTERGASLGLLEMVASRRATATLRAETQVRVLRVSAERWAELIEDSFDIALAVLASIAGELASHGRARFGDGPSLRHTEIPDHDLDFAERILALRASLPFSKAPIRALAVLAERATLRALPRAAVLWDRGREAREIMLMLEGAVAEANCLYGPGETVGLVEALAGRRREFTAVARTSVRALAFDVESLLDVLEEEEELVDELLRTLASELLDVCLARGLPPDVLSGAPDRSLPRASRSPFDTAA